MEIELWRCEYKARCSAPGCKAPATTLVRQLDAQWRIIRKFELCDQHVKQALAAGGAKIHDWRHDVPYS
jgi:hypothetical protein